MIPKISYTKFRRLTAENIQELKSIEVTADGETLFVAIIPPKAGGMTINDSIKTEAVYLALRGNTVGGKDPEELLMVEA